jgi:hypothetical protein
MDITQHGESVKSNIIPNYHSQGNGYYHAPMHDRDCGIASAVEVVIGDKTVAHDKET